METVINIENLSKRFGNKEVLNGLDLSLKEKENLVVLGRSGSGKSVLIKCIIGLIRPDAGTINVLGKEITSLDEETLNTLRQELSFLFQSGALYDSLSVEENLAFPLRINNPHIARNELKERVQQALEDVGLPDTRKKMPSELSGGMRKRIGLARTIIVQPKIILYDEPTTGLDTQTSHEISELIVELKKRYDTSSVIITHDIPCARLTADRMMVLNEGKFVAEGTYAEISKSSDDFVQSFFYKL